MTSFNEWDIYSMVWRLARVFLLLPPLLILCLWGWYEWRYRQILAAARKMPTGLPTLPLLGHFYLLLLHGHAGMSTIFIKAAKTCVADGVKSFCVWLGPYPMFLFHDIKDVRNGLVLLPILVFPLQPFLDTGAFEVNKKLTKQAWEGYRHLTWFQFFGQLSKKTLVDGRDQAFTRPLIQTILTSPITSEKSGDYDIFKLFLENGLVSSTGPIHKITRAHMNPLFRMSNLKHLMPVFNQSSRHIVDSLSQHLGRGPLDFQQFIRSLSLRNIASLMFGPDVKYDLDSGDFERLNSVLEGIKTISIQRIFKIWLWSDAFFYLLWRKLIEEIDSGWKSFTDGPLKELKEKQLNLQKDEDKIKFPSTDEDRENVPLTMPAVYAAMRQNYPQFTDKDFHCEMRTLLMAGSNTSRNATCYLLLSLAALPKIQERVYEEIMSVVGPDKDVTVQDIQDMPYLDQVYKETLRYHCIIGIWMRRVLEDIQLGDYTVPAGATVGITTYGVHFDPEVYHDPENFDPDRFSPENAAKLQRWNYLPFSTGPRNCIGGQYAALSMKTVTVHLLKSYRLSTSMDINNLKYRSDLSTVSADGYNIELHNRN